MKLAYCYHLEASGVRFQAKGYANIKMRPAILTNGRSRTNVLYIEIYQGTIDVFLFHTDYSDLLNSFTGRIGRAIARRPTKWKLEVLSFPPNAKP